MWSAHALDFYVFDNVWFLEVGLNLSVRAKCDLLGSFASIPFRIVWLETHRPVAKKPLSLNMQRIAYCVFRAVNKSLFAVVARGEVVLVDVEHTMFLGINSIVFP
ncbi:hypothetical protein TNCV_4045561 [Trichonephila clavipes]|nr:hypothetical protein TNCV_4045561 [Trichonephila clavipes]